VLTFSGHCFTRKTNGREKHMSITVILGALFGKAAVGAASKGVAAAAAKGMTAKGIAAKTASVGTKAAIGGSNSGAVAGGKVAAGHHANHATGHSLAQKIVAQAKDELVDKVTGAATKKVQRRWPWSRSKDEPPKKA
jgi:hypothetical protein